MKGKKLCKKRQSGITFKLMHLSVAPSFCFISLLILLKMLPLSTCLTISFNTVKLLNENSTLLHPLMSDSQNTTTRANSSDPLNFEGLPWWCHYLSDIEESDNESECHCEGPKLLKIPQNLPQITRLSIANAKFKVLREAGLRKYSSSLRDL